MVTKMELKLRIIVKSDMILGEIPQIFTISTGFKALELAFTFWSHENDNDTVVCSIEPR